MLPKVSWVPLRYINPALDAGHPPLADWLLQAKAFGLDYVEIYHHLLPSKDLAGIGKLRDLLHALEIGVSMYTCAPDFTHPDPNVREAEQRAMEWNVQVARGLGAEGVRVTAGCEHPEVSRAEGLAWAAEHLCRLGDFAAARRVKLGFENHYRDRRWTSNDFCFHTDVFLDLFDLLRDSEVGVNFDASNQLMTGDDPMTVLEVVWPRVWHVHASDRFPGRYAHSVIGEGSVDFDAIFRFLATHGYAGYISLEDGNPEGDEGSWRAIQFIRRKVLQWWT
jgi:sugar phosphate isomerase/epimerase